jgi:hypothetical protein
MPEIRSENRNMITTLDGKIIKDDPDTITEYIYNDYTNLNIQVIEQYNLDLDIFYNELPEFNNIIEEIPMDKIQLVVDKMGIIIENSNRRKEYVFNMDNINTFIKTSIDLTRAELIDIFK